METAKEAIRAYEEADRLTESAPEYDRLRAHIAIGQASAMRAIAARVLQSPDVTVTDFGEAIPPPEMGYSGLDAITQKPDLLGWLDDNFSCYRS